MINIVNCPSNLAEGYSTYSPKARKALFDGKKISHLLDFNIDEFHTAGELAEAMRRISVSGVQEKFPAILKDSQIRIAGDDDRSTYILKPAPWDKTLAERKQIPANENLTMQIASRVYGINTAENGLCFTPKGEMVYITKRFDLLPDGTKLLMEDFASVLGHTEQTDGKHFKYSGCYEDIADAIRKNVSAWKVDMERFFNLVVFNYIYANGDDHLNTSVYVNGDDPGLDGGLSPNIARSDVYENTGHPCRVDFERFGLHIGLLESRVTRILDRYMSLPEVSSALIGRSFLGDKAKRHYLRIVNERIARFTRTSD